MAKKRKAKPTPKPTPTSGESTPRRPQRTPATGGDESKLMLAEWWQENGKYLVAGAILGILAIGGWKGWEYYEEYIAMGAAVEYETFLDYIALEDEVDASESLNTLRDKYRMTAYPDFASLAMAKFHVEQDDLAAAAESLRWITEHSRNEALQLLAQVRLARVLFALGEKQAAYDIVLSASFPEGLAELASELEGDYWVQEGEGARAKEAYQRAISNSISDDFNFIMMKMGEIADPAQPAEDTQAEDTQPKDMQSTDTQSENAQSEYTQPEEAQSEEAQPEDMQSADTQFEDMQSEDTQSEDTQAEGAQPEEIQSESTQ